MFKPIATKVPGIQVTEILPKLAQITDKFTFIRSMSYTPNGLFNHTAAIYQMMTGYTTDKVSPSGQLEPPSPKDFPNFGSQLIRLQPQTVPMLPFVMLPRPLQESNVVGKGGIGRLPGQGVRSVHALPRRRRHGHGQDGPDQGRRPAAPARGLRPAARAPGQAPRRDRTPACRRSTRPWPTSSSTSITTGRSRLIVSGRAREAFNLQAESPQTRDLYGRNTFGQSCLLARRLVEAGTKVVEVIWPKVANSDNHSWDHHADLTNRMRDQSGPMLDQGLSGLLTDLDQRGLLEGHAGRRRRRVRPQPAEGRQHLGQRQQRRRPRPLAVLLHGRRRRRRHPPRPRPRQVRQDRLGPAVRSRPPGRAAGHDLPRLRHRPGHDRLQPPQPAPRAGQGRRRDPAVRLSETH